MHFLNNLLSKLSNASSVVVYLLISAYITKCKDVIENDFSDL